MGNHPYFAVSVDHETWEGNVFHFPFDIFHLIFVIEEDQIRQWRMKNVIWKFDPAWIGGNAGQPGMKKGDAKFASPEVSR